MTALFLHLRSGSYDDLHTAFSLAATQASLGEEAHLYLAWGALARVCDDALDDAPVTCGDPTVRAAMERAIERGQLPGLRELLDGARASGLVHLHGCSTSIQVLRVPPEGVDRLDSVMGHATFLRRAQGAWLVVL